MAKLFTSEILCFIFNKYGQFTKTQLKSALVGFYTEDELISGKDVLHCHLTELVTTSSLGCVVPRYVKRPANDNRMKMTADDLWELATFADENGLLKDLPTYCAVRLDRIPVVKVEDLDVFCIMKKLDRMESRLVSLESTDMKEVATKIDRIETRMNMPSSKSTAQPIQVGPTGAHVTSVYVPSSDSAILPPTSEDWEVPRYHRQKIRVRGTKVFDTSEAATSEAATIRAVPRQKVLTAFVGRLHKSTTEEELTKFLTAEGMKGVVCKKLAARDGRVFPTAAFRVTCCPESSDLFYDHQCWPEGAELRDWIFRYTGTPVVNHNG